MNAFASIPEYLHVFGEDGPVAVTVEGPDGPLAMPVRRIRAEDMAWLVSTDGQLLRQHMSFSGAVRAVRACVLNPTQQSITIHVA